MDDLAASSAAPADVPMVRVFREILLYPLQLTRPPGQISSAANWERLLFPGSVWHDAADDPVGRSAAHREQHYTEFVAFMPDVQRFLYGEGTGVSGAAQPVPPSLRVFRRNDVVAARVILQPGTAAIMFAIPRVELVFFYDVDIAVLVVEVATENLTLAQAQDTLFRLGRAYPGSWNDAGHAVHCCETVEWLDRDGQVLA